MPVTQIGVEPVHAAVLVAVHATHWLVAVLHAGVGNVHVVLLVHGSHLPAFVPPTTHAPVRHWAVAVQVPLPAEIPFGDITAPPDTPLGAQAAIQLGWRPAVQRITWNRLPIGKRRHTPTRCDTFRGAPAIVDTPAAPARTFQPPSATSPIGRTVAAFALVHEPSRWCHNFTLPSLSQTPLRQIHMALAADHVPLPFIRPHLLSVSQVLAVQTTSFCAVQIPKCNESLGIATPFASVEEHVSDDPLQ